MKLSNKQTYYSDKFRKIRNLFCTMFESFNDHKKIGSCGNSVLQYEKNFGNFSSLKLTKSLWELTCEMKDEEGSPLCCFPKISKSVKAFVLHTTVDISAYVVIIN